MLLRKKLWATAALCLVFLLWKTFQGRCTGHFASLCTFVESSGPVFLFKAKLCSCASCVADLNSSAWFNEHYDAAINPVLTVQTQEISPDVLQWWLVSNRITSVHSGTSYHCCLGRVCQAPPRGRMKVKQWRRTGQGSRVHVGALRTSPSIDPLRSRATAREPTEVMKISNVLLL